MDLLDSDEPMLRVHLTSRRFPLSVGVAGLLLLIPGALFGPSMLLG
jgi:hypothetical protein